MEYSFDRLFSYAYKGRVEPTKKDILIESPPKHRFIKADLSQFDFVNRGGFKIENCFVYYPSGQLEKIKALIDFEIGGHCLNCSFFFFRIPDRRSSVKFELSGKNQVMTFFSTRRLLLTVKSVYKNCYLTVGDYTYIGGARMILMDTSVTVGAGGLWSDGVLIQGADGHGIVDLDTLEIINSKSRNIEIQPRVWLGRQCIVTKNVTIGEGSVVATAAVVSRDVPPACAVAGVPARVVRQRVSWSQRQTVISPDEKNDMIRLRNQVDQEQPASQGSTLAPKATLAPITTDIHQPVRKRGLLSRLIARLI